MKIKIQKTITTEEIDIISYFSVRDFRGCGTIPFEYPKDLRPFCIVDPDSGRHSYYEQGRLRTMDFRRYITCKGGWVPAGCRIRLVKAVRKPVYIELVGGVRTVAGFDLCGHEAPDESNEGAIDLFVHDSIVPGMRTLFDEIKECADAMCKAHPESCGQWKLVDAEGRRTFVWIYDYVDLEN